MSLEQPLREDLCEWVTACSLTRCQLLLNPCALQFNDIVWIWMHLSHVRCSTRVCDHAKIV